MEQITSYINFEEIVEFVKEQEDYTSEQDLNAFVEYLEIDFHDWLRTNWNKYLQDKPQTL